MQYLEITEGLSIRVEEIEAVERGTANTSVIHTHHQTYPSTFPYEVVLQLLEMRDKPKENMAQLQMLNILKEQGNYSG